MKLKLFLSLSIIFVLAFCALGEEKSPWSWQIKDGMLNVTLQVPESYIAYADETRVLLDPETKAKSVPKTESKFDPFENKNSKIYPAGSTNVWAFPAAKLRYPVTVRVFWQFCRTGEKPVCLLPASLTLAELASADGKLVIPAERKEKPDKEPVVPVDDAELTAETFPDSAYVMIPDYKLLRVSTGYLSPAKMIAFLNGDPDGDPALTFAGKGVLMTLLIALLGGLALNFTPCVLPLIPVNLAVIGASGTSGRSRFARILRGTVYGLGIAVTYGVLGTLAVLTGSTFGEIAGTWWFNCGAALIFALLGLAMFGIFSLDFSRFSGGRRLPSGANYGGVFLLGALSAALAGACVAPVLTAALVEASILYSEGSIAGLFLPFLIGAGMALPWPFLAAGLSLLPRPGAWMNKVKYVLGCLILALAFYYGYTGASILNRQIAARSVPVEELQPEPTYTQIAQALQKSRVEDKPVLLDFGASWCKSCMALETHTFADPQVKELLKKFIVVRIRAEDPSEPETASLLRKFAVTGLPTLVVLEPDHFASR